MIFLILTKKTMSDNKVDNKNIRTKMTLSYMTKTYIVRPNFY